jgi:hypothetical protein
MDSTLPENDIKTDCDSLSSPDNDAQQLDREPVAAPPQIPGFTDGFGAEELQPAWERVLAKLGYVNYGTAENPEPYDSFCLFDEPYYPYCIPLTGPVTPENAHQLLPVQVEKHLTTGDPQKLLRLLNTDHFDARTSKCFELWIRNIVSGKRYKIEQLLAWLPQFPKEFQNTALVIIGSEQKKTILHEPGRIFEMIDSLSPEFFRYLTIDGGDIAYGGFAKLTAAAVLQLKILLQRPIDIPELEGYFEHPFVDAIFALVQGANPDTPLEIPHMCIDHFPASVREAYFRDLGRIFDRHPELVRPEIVPANVEGDFEDPLNIGKKYWRALAKEKLPEMYTNHAQRAQAYIKGQLLIERTGSTESKHQAYNNIFNQWGVIDDRQIQTKETGPSNDSRIKAYIAGMQSVNRLPAFLFVVRMLETYTELRGIKKASFLQTQLGDILDSDPDGHALFPLMQVYILDSQFKQDLLAFLKKSSRYLKYFIRLGRTARSPRTAAFAMKILADYCGKSFDPPNAAFSKIYLEKYNRTLKETIRKLFPDEDALREQQLAENYQLFALFLFYNDFSNSQPDPGKTTGMRMDVSEQVMHDFFLHLHSSILANKEFLEEHAYLKVLERNPEYLTHDFQAFLRKFPVFAELDQTQLATVCRQLFPRRHPSHDTLALISRSRFQDCEDAADLEKLLPACAPVNGPETSVTALQIDAENFIYAYTKTATGNPSPNPYAGLEITLVRPRLTDTTVDLEIIKFPSAEISDNTFLYKNIVNSLHHIYLQCAYTHLSQYSPQTLRDAKRKLAGEDPTAAPELTPASEPAPITAPSAEPAPEKKKAANGKKKRSYIPLTIDLRPRERETINENSESLAPRLSENQKNFIRFLNGALPAEEIPNLILHRRLPGLGQDKFVYERVNPADIPRMFADGSLFAPEICILTNTPHFCAQPYQTPKRLEPGETIYDVTQAHRSPNAEIAYNDYYRKSGLPDLGPLGNADGILRLQELADPGHGHFASIKYTDNQGGIKEFMAHTSRPDSTMQLAQRIYNDNYLDVWADAQIAALKREIREILAVSLSRGEKVREIKLRRRQIQDFGEKKMALRRNTRLAPEGMRRDTLASIQLGLGWVTTELSFNQGDFDSITEFLAANAGELPALGDYLKMPEAESAPAIDPAASTANDNSKANGEDRNNCLNRKNTSRSPELVKNDIIREVGSEHELVTYQKMRDLFGSKLENDETGNFASPDANIEAGTTDKNAIPDPNRASIIEKTERAAGAHLKALMALYGQMKPLSDHVYVGTQSFDLLTVHGNCPESGNHGILWEVKSINTSGYNEDKQLRTALGQLWEYEFYGVRNRPELSSRLGPITKAVLLSEKPRMLKNGRAQATLDYLTFLEKSAGIYVYWLEEGHITGTPSAMGHLQTPLSPPA